MWEKNKFYEVPVYTYSQDGEVIGETTDLTHVTEFNGFRKELLPIYRSMYKAWRNNNSRIAPRYTDFPVMATNKLYTLEIQWEQLRNYDSELVFDPEFWIRRY